MGFCKYLMLFYFILYSQTTRSYCLEIIIVKFLCVYYCCVQRTRPLFLSGRNVMFYVVVVRKMTENVNHSGQRDQPNALYSHQAIVQGINYPIRVF